MKIRKGSTVTLPESGEVGIVTRLYTKYGMQFAEVDVPGRAEYRHALRHDLTPATLADKIRNS